MAEKPKKFIECLIPVTACNLRCPYCYVIQEKRRTDAIPPMAFGLATIKHALRAERFGGICFFSLCGAGETLIPEYTIPIAKAILENGHFINITTNGTMTKRFHEMKEQFSPEEFSRTAVAFSFHYLELKRLNLLDRFFDNIDLVRNAGASIVLQLNLCDEYLPFLDEIKAISMERLGAWPQLAATRAEETYPITKVRLRTQLTPDEYYKVGHGFDSPLFETTMQNFNKPQALFCYNGDWAYVLNLGSGFLHRCYNSVLGQNIFKYPDAPIRNLAVGMHCNMQYCFNSTHFHAIGSVRDPKTPSYVQLRDRPDAGWYQDRMKQFLSHKLDESNEEYGRLKKCESGIAGYADHFGYCLYAAILRSKQKK